MSGGRQDARDTARAIDALRRGWPVVVGAGAYLAVETAGEDDLTAFDRGGPADLLISGHRAVTLKLANQREGTPTGPVLIRRASWIGSAEAIAIADPALDLSRPLKGPFQALPQEDHRQSAAALALARRAGLLPALFVGGAAGHEPVRVTPEAVEALDGASSLSIAARAKLPTRSAEKGEVVAFRSAEDASEHVALVLGSPNGRPPLVRLHSECLTGDVLGSLKCDCGPQLAAALDAIAAAGWGMLLYLRQEGRGIGIVNKLRAYALQDQGFDTVDANLRLGFADDERDFTVAAAMLKLLGQDEVSLLTNNPRKAEGLGLAGIRVAGRVPLRAGENPHNADYLATKRSRSGHV